MRPEVARHPDYPFGREREALLRARASAFLDVPESGGRGRAALLDFVTLAHAFAFLERLVQGEVLCDLPAHASRILQSASGDPQDEGERLAEAEEDLLEWTAGSVDSLVEALDTIGVKVFMLGGEGGAAGGSGPSAAGESGPSAAGEGGPGAAGESGPGGDGGRDDLFGAFCFEAEVGPAVLAGAAEDTPEASFILAHEFGHLVADVDPYRSRFCRWQRRTLENRSTRPEEARADRFARALLMPAGMFLQSLRDLGPAGGAGAERSRDTLATLFGVPGELVRRRLADFGILEPPPVGESGESASALPPPPPPASEEGESAGALLPLPERYVHLALAAYGGDVFDPATLARFLRTTEEEALRVADWAGVHPGMSAAGEAEG